MASLNVGILLLSELIISVILMQFSSDITEFTSTSLPLSIISRITTLIILAILYAFFNYFLVKFEISVKKDFPGILFYLPIPISQLILLAGMLFVSSTSSVPPGTAYIYIVATIGVILADVMFFHAISKAQREQIIKEELRLARYQIEARTSTISAL